MRRLSRPSARARIAIAAALAAAALPMVALDVGASEACSAAPAPGGEWTSYGHDLTNSRTQPDEDAIGLLEAPTLEVAFAARMPGPLGTINSTPVVGGGCVFLNAAYDSTHAVVTALSSDTGTQVWSTTIDVGTAAYAGPAVGAPALWDDLLIVPVNKLAGPFVVALDRDTGEERWTSQPLDIQPSAGTNASITVWDGVVFLGFFGRAGPWTEERGGFALYDATLGTLLKRTYTIPDADFAEKYAGAGIWGTAAVDEATGYAYVGTSNPHNPQKVHERSDSLLKIDLNRGSPTFGEIISSYQGIRDTVVPDGEKQPVCETKPDVYYVGQFSATCLAIDVDFGASPNLVDIGDGRTLLGAQQKSGTYHVVDTADMSRVSLTQVGAPCFACSGASSAFSDGRAFVPAGPPGQMVSVDVGTLGVGVPAWASPIAGGFTYNPASVANGLVWTVDSAGFLDAFDALTGALVVKRPLQAATGQTMFTATSSAGVAIANHAIYAALGSWVVAYRLPS